MKDKRDKVQEGSRTTGVCKKVKKMDVVANSERKSVEFEKQKWVR